MLILDVDIRLLLDISIFPETLMVEPHVIALSPFVLNFNILLFEEVFVEDTKVFSVVISNAFVKLWCIKNVCLPASPPFLDNFNPIFLSLILSA